MNKEGKEVEEVDEVKEIEEKNGRVAAFFDLDGTLLPLPSMERRFFWMLRSRRSIGMRNFLSWIAEAARLAPRGIHQIAHANKMYLRGVRVDEVFCGTDTLVCPFAEVTHTKEEKKQPKKRQARMPVLRFYPEAIEQVAWHAKRGHEIVLVTGTLEPLAEQAARALEAELHARGVSGEILICATRLEQNGDRWTGRILGEAMFGEAKARAVRRVAAEAGLDLRRCFAYGDSTRDRWMLDAVGKPMAVNPSADLARIARRNGWPVLQWGKENHLTQSAQRPQRAQGESDSQAAHVIAEDEA
jgi:HAD superfamily hydrolase (TIGR01490 family)